MGEHRIEAFRIEVPEADLEELRRRLRATRWPEEEPVDDWSQGVPLAYLQEVCTTWAEDYDWRRVEARLNELPQFRTEIDGVGIHFLHLRSDHDEARPLLLTHGWPGSILEFLDVLEPLRSPTEHGGEPGDAFHLVCPSLPGYGFSDRPAVAGWGIERVGAAWSELMARLGYERYFAQGGDWGGAATAEVALQDPDHCAGIHLNIAMSGPDPETLEDPTAEEQDALRRMKHYQDHDSGYSKQQGTRPQTLGYALTDSPAGQAAWILEKFWSWTDCDGHPENAVPRERLLNNVSLYWLTATAASSARLYWESFGRTRRDPVDTPTGFSMFPHEIFQTSRRWAERRFRNLVYWNRLDRGGHFAALEQPDLFVAELRACFGAMALD